VSRYAATRLIVSLCAGHSDITGFIPWSPIMTGQQIIWIAPNEKIPKFAQTTLTLKFLIHVQACCDPLCGELPRVHILMNDGPNPHM
jgi:hypothetical protein